MIISVCSKQRKISSMLHIALGVVVSLGVGIMVSYRLFREKNWFWVHPILYFCIFILIELQMPKAFDILFAYWAGSVIHFMFMFGLCFDRGKRWKIISLTIIIVFLSAIRQNPVEIFSVTGKVLVLIGFHEWCQHDRVKVILASVILMNTSEILSHVNELNDFSLSVTALICLQSISYTMLATWFLDRYQETDASVVS